MRGGALYDMGSSGREAFRKYEGDSQAYAYDPVCGRRVRSHLHNQYIRKVRGEVDSWRP